MMNKFLSVVLLACGCLIECGSDFIDADFALSAAQGTKRRAGFFTPFSMTPGGGERYFLNSAVALHQMGYAVEIILEGDNPCRTESCVEETLNALRIQIKFEDIPLRIVPEFKYLPDEEYDIFFAMGITKYPEYMSKGKFNIYMCQFPFDYAGEKVLDYVMERYSSYDQVIVNSRFTHDWYVKSTLRGVAFLLSTDLPVPTISILHPPVLPFEMKPLTAESNSLDAADTSNAKLKANLKLMKQLKRVEVAICGRFFRGRQSKGHDYALRLLIKLKEFVPQRPIHLNMIGFVHPDQKSFDYVEELRQNATDQGMSVSFFINADGYEIAAALSKSTIYWHLTGVNLLNDTHPDPASFEHFGIAIVEAMYSGCIPIVTSLGGVTDIVKHNYNGLIASTEHEFLTHTLTLLAATHDEIARLRHNALRSANQFSVRVFVDRLQSIVTRGVRSKVLRNITTYKEPAVEALKVQTTLSTTKLSAIIIETGYATNLKLCVRNVMHHVGIGWKLNVYHSNRNRNVQYMRALLHVRANFIPLEVPVLSKADYDALLKDPLFWKRYAKDEKILLFRSDVLLVRKGIQEFWGYDFISAPLLNTLRHTQRSLNVNMDLNSSSGQFVFSDHIFDYKELFDRGVGHGAGISIRTAGVMQKIALECGNDTSIDESEGVFFARNAARLGYKVASANVSYSFAWEAEMPEFGSSFRLPMALRGVWLHMRTDLIDGLVIRNSIPTAELSVQQLPSTKEALHSLLLSTPLVLPPSTDFASKASRDNDDDEDGGDEGLEDAQEDAQEEEESVTTVQQLPVASSYPLLDGQSRETGLFWKFIHTPAALLGGDVKKMNQLLLRLGVLGPDDLRECNDTNIKEMQELIKPVQRNKLIALLNPPKLDT